MRTDGIAAHGGPSHGQGVPVPTTARPIGTARRQGRTIPLLNEVPVHAPVEPPKPKATGTSREGLRRPLTGPDDPRHGTRSAYTEHKCRCDKCRAENAAESKRLREQRKTQPEPTPP